MLYGGAVEAAAAAGVMDFGTKPKSDRPESAKRERSEDGQVGGGGGGQRRAKAAGKGGVDAMLLMSSSAGGVVEGQLGSGSLVFEDERNMLSFSSPGGAEDEKMGQNAALQLCYPQSVCSRTSGDFGLAGSLTSPNMHAPFAGARQLFTQNQWFELEQQALIYKYIAANVSVPSNLIIPIKKSFNPWGLPGSISPNGSLSSSSFGWGPFHLGFHGSTDPEPGRCRRTDGKKWRCAKDAVHGHKYCEKHLNRGRHRSRKPVEGQKPDQSVAGAANFANKVAPMASSLSKASVMPGGRSANGLAAKGAHSTLNPFTDLITKRTQDLQGISMLSPAISLGSKDASFAIPKPKDPFEESYQSEFGFVSSDYLQNPYQKISSCLNSSFVDFSDQDSRDQHPLRQFMEDWPKERSEHSSLTWQDETKPDWTKLSMAIPVVSSGLSSSASSPTHERLALSPLRLGLEFHQNEMGANEFGEPFPKDPAYMPWGSSAGGPLGEVLKISSSKRPHIENPSGLNLMTKGWDGAKAQFEPSPTGVLLKSAFGSLSNSSAGSSPRGESRMTSEAGSLCNDAPGSTTLVSSLPFS
uniref:Growth-regulating factor n=2 Tax=Kalanchoe fedtschenkoi TaxID=63787 RepID=A0A7N0ZRW6_KALFE